MNDTSSKRHLHFVTGKLAHAALRAEVAALAEKLGFQFSIEVLPITVAALMTSKWMVRRWTIPAEATEVIVPGYVDDLERLQQATTIPVRRGPRDLRDLAVFFGQAAEPFAIEDAPFDIRILAEINHAPRLPRETLYARARQARREGADMIDLGCQPGRRWQEVAQVVRDLKAEGFAISVDTFDAWEAAMAAAAGADLILSVNSGNCAAAKDWGCEVVAIPDAPDDLDSLERTVETLTRDGVSMRLDPILEPIGMGGGDPTARLFGLSGSLVRYATVRQRYPQHRMMMGIGNLTELTDVDSAGVNTLLLGICQELQIDSVLTTEVINWARTSVRECDRARRLVAHAVGRGIPPKNLSDALVMLRDLRLRPYPPEVLAGLAEQLKDNNYRLFAQDEAIHLISAGLHLQHEDPFALFAELMQQPQSDNVDPGHAFYLGFEMAKALTALTLGKQYEQDEALRWGMLTREEDHHRLERTARHRRQASASPPPRPDPS